MNTNELLNTIHELQYTSCVNQRYHQAQAARCLFFQRILRSGVALGTIISFSMLASDPLPVWSVCTAVCLALMIGVVFGVIPNRARRFQDLFRRWTELRRDAEALDLYVTESIELNGQAIGATQWLNSLVSRRHSIEENEVAPDESLLQKAQGDENYSRFGQRSYKDVLKHLDSQTVGVLEESANP